MKKGLTLAKLLKVKKIMDKLPTPKTWCGFKVISTLCPDCKIEMEFIIPNNMENYYKCPRCCQELTEEEAKESEAL